jgi:hypothetical protein
MAGTERMRRQPAKARQDDATRRRPTYPRQAATPGEPLGCRYAAHDGHRQQAANRAKDQHQRELIAYGERHGRRDINVVAVACETSGGQNSSH